MNNYDRRYFLKVKRAIDNISEIKKHTDYIGESLDNEMAIKFFSKSLVEIIAYEDDIYDDLDNEKLVIYAKEVIRRAKDVLKFNGIKLKEAVEMREGG